MWYSSVRSNRSLRSPALSTSHTGGSPSHPRISQADAPPLPASASATFAPLRCARGFGPFAALTLGTRGRANTTAHRSAHYAPLCGLHTVRCAHSRGPHNTGWKYTLETQTRGVGTPQDQHRHRGALHGAEGLSVGRPHRRSTAWCAPAAARVGPGRLHAHAPVPARSSRYALHSLRLAATLVPASLPARRVRRLRIARLRSLRSGGPGGSVPQYRCAGPVPRAPGGSGSTIPSAARRHPRPSSRYRVCRRGGAASHLRCCPPSTRRTSGAVRVPFHPALRCARYPRPPPLKTTLVTRAGTRGLFAALTTRQIPLTLVIPVPRTDVLLPLRSSRLVPSLEHLCGPAIVPSAYRRIRHPVSAPPYSRAGLRELSASRPVRPVSNDRFAPGRFAPGRSARAAYGRIRPHLLAGSGSGPPS